jgi:hypothetical protein
VWRLLFFLVVAAAVANPLVLLLDRSDDPLLEGSLENACVAGGFQFGVVPVGVIVLVWCGTSLLFGLPNSGKPSIAAILALDTEGPSLWTGGSFGPEGGLLATIVVAAALLAGFASRRRWSHTDGIVLSLAEPPPLARRSDLR